MFRKSLPLLLVLTLALTACSFRINLPFTQPVGPIMVDEISLPVPAGHEVIDLRLEFGAGTLILNPGTEALISGTASYNVDDLKPEITVNESQVSIKQGEWRINAFPDMSKVKNEWDLALGNVPIDLTIQAGAYKAEYELGGLSLVNLTVEDGAANVELAFSQPNGTEMTLLQYQTGASNVSLTGLGNANFAAMEFDGGAGNYTLDFTGELKRNASVNIEAGVSNTILVIPSGVPVQITVDGGLGKVSYASGWEKNGNVYTQEGSGPQLTIVIEMGAGNLSITR